jgi:hypothetical protein
MPKHPNDRLQGTLDLLILKALSRSGPLHGYAIARGRRTPLEVFDGSR